MKNYDKNSGFELSGPSEDDSTLFFSIGYESFEIEVNVEILIYDIGSFLAAVGGNLGLFLGFSCLSLLFVLMKTFNHLKIFKKFSTNIQKQQTPYK